MTKVSINSLYDSKVFSDNIESQYESLPMGDELAADQSTMPHVVLGGANDTQIN